MLWTGFLLHQYVCGNIQKSLGLPEAHSTSCPSATNLSAEKNGLSPSFCSRWGLVFFLMPLSGNHVSSHLYFLLLSLPYLILSVCHLMLRTYFTATTDHASGCPSDKKWWSVCLPILSWLCEQKRDLLALIMAIVGFGDVKARQKQAGRDVCIVASFSQKCLEPFIHNP